MEETEPPYRERKALPENVDIQRALTARSRDAIVGVNRKGTIIFWDKGAEQVFGYSSLDIVGQPVTKLISEKHRAEHTLVLKAFLSGNRGETGLIEGEALRKDGSTFPLELSLSIQQQDGKFWGLAVGRDVTEQKNREQALNRSAERYGNLFATCLEAVFSAEVLDNSGAGNKGLDGLRRYCLKELTEMRPANALPSESSERLSRQIDEILSADEPAASIVHEILRTHGKRILMKQHLNLINRTCETPGCREFTSGITEGEIGEEQSPNYLLNLARTVSRVIESCDPYTAGHQKRVAELACLVGENMGLATDIVERLYLDGLLHDIGKVSIPRSILTKPGQLTEEEWALIRAHTRQGYSILKDANLPWPIAEVALQHHERLDGSGYPQGITGDRLGLEVSVLAVCDVVEAMSSHRAYRPARTTAEVVKELKDGRGVRYDAGVVDVMLPMVEGGEFKYAWDPRN